MITETEKIAGIIKLSQNENPFGASPAALKAISDNFHSIYRYPEFTHLALREKLGHKFSTPADNIAISAGSVEMIELIIKTFVGRAENIVTCATTFVAYKLLAKVNRRECRLSRLDNEQIDLIDMAAVCDDLTRVVFLANPNNPTGAMVSHDGLRNLLQSLSPEILVVSDEAYAEYVTDSDYPDSLKLQKEHPNLIILRTFSKIYGLAGLRIGYAIAQPKIIQALRESRTPFSVNRLAALAASAALDDIDFTTRCTELNSQQRDILYQEITDLGLKTVPSHGNFLFVRFASVVEKFKTLYSLKESGILARDMEPFGAKTCLRISVGRPEENRRLVECIRLSNK